MKIFFQQIGVIPYKILFDGYFRRFLWAILFQKNNVLKFKVKGFNKKIKLEFIEKFSALFQFREIFSDKSYQFNSASKKPIIIDCGSNIGTSLIYFKSMYPNCEIHSFEADPHIFQLLKKNIETNNFSEDIYLNNNAVWNKNEILYFENSGVDHGKIQNANANNTIEIKGLRLSEYINTFNQVDFLKIDIEGAELEVITDCKDALKKVNNLFVEYHSFTNQEQHLDKILSAITYAGLTYHLSSINFVEAPLSSKKIRNSEMNLQLNIHAYRV